MIQIPLAVASRLGPWLTRSGKGAVDKAIQSVGNAGITGIKSLDDLVRYVKGSPVQAGATFLALASSGFAVSDLLSPGDKSDIEVRTAAATLSVEELRQMDVKLIDVAGESEVLSGISGNKQDLLLLQRVLRFARGHYGSAAAAMEAWKLHQSFFELSLADVENGYAVLNV